MHLSSISTGVYRVKEERGNIGEGALQRDCKGEEFHQVREYHQRGREEVEDNEGSRGSGAGR